MNNSIAQNAEQFLDFEAVARVTKKELTENMYKAFKRFRGATQADNINLFCERLSPAIQSFYDGMPDKKADKKGYDARAQDIGRLFNALNAQFAEKGIAVLFNKKKASNRWAAIWAYADSLSKVTPIASAPTARDTQAGNPSNNGSTANSANPQPERDATILEAQLKANPKAMLKAAIRACAASGMSAAQIEAVVTATLKTKAVAKLADKAA